MKYSILTALLMIILLSLQLQAQQLTVSYNAISFQELVKDIESRTTYHFYYNAASTDSLRLSLEATDKSLNAILSQLLANTGLHFAIDQHHRIYITAEREIMTEIPTGVFGKAQTTQSQTQATRFDYSAYEKREKEKKVIESRLFAIGARTTNMQGNATLAGNVRDVANGEAVIGASVYVEGATIGSSTDQFGFYSLTMPKGRYQLKIKSVGMKATTRQIILYADGKFDIELDQDVVPLKEVVIESNRDARVSQVEMGVERLDIKTMKNMPLALGETDIMKVVMTLPGVQTVGEGTVGLNVRGGAANQNLILFNDAVVYNPSHLFGFFSTFNPDVLKNVELYKSGITADYGGRLSSVLDVSSREGNNKKFSASGGISPITARFTIEGPLIKEKTSFLLGGRTTYSDWILRQLDDNDLKNSEASFYDVNLHVSHAFNAKNNLYFSGYISQDRFRLASDTSYRYSDRNMSLKWKNVINNKLYFVVTGSMSQYDYNVESTKIPVNAFNMSFKIQQVNGKVDVNYFLNASHTLTAGASVTRYELAPGNYHPHGDASLVIPNDLHHEQGLESAVYIGDQFEVSPKFSLYGGVRYSFFQTMGPKDVFQYAPGIARKTSTIVDTLHYEQGQTIASYHGIEPRFTARYVVGDRSSLKLGYTRMRQYIQMLTNSTAITPTDVWKLSDTYVQPQIGDQYSLGFYQTLRKGTIELSVETYYKAMQNMTDYRDGATLLLNHHIETDIVSAQGEAYGGELMIRKAAGKLNGWISYTYSRTLLRVKETSKSESVNHGSWYPASYDKPHSLNLVGNYKFSRRVNFSMNTTYSTGRPISLPVGIYDIDDTPRPYYSERNHYRIPDYFRIDISLNIEGNHKSKKLAHSSWSVAVYNLTGRDNAYSVFFRSENGAVKGYKLSIFAKPIPTVTYNFRF